MTDVSRRMIMGTGAVAAVGGLAAAALAPRAQAQPAPDAFDALAHRAQSQKADPALIAAIYRQVTQVAGGSWHSRVAVLSADGKSQDAVAHDADHLIGAASVQKIAIAVAVLDKVDRGQLSLGQKVNLPGDIILGGSGIYHLQTVWGDDLTLANVLTALLLVSDNTAVRLCGKLVPGPEINEIFAAKGLVKTRVEPLPTNPNRFFLGSTTPREVTDLLVRLVKGELLSDASTTFLLGILRALNGYHDGIRRAMSSQERLQIATKYGALKDLRHEAGVVFDAAGHPALAYAFFANGVGDPDNYGATNPAVRAHAVLGRVLVSSLGSSALRTTASDRRRTWPAPAVAFEGELGG